MYLATELIRKIQVKRPEKIVYKIYHKNRMKDSVIRIKMDGLDEDEDDEVEEENYGYFDEDLTEEEKEAIKENEKGEIYNAGQIKGYI